MLRDVEKGVHVVVVGMGEEPGVDMGNGLPGDFPQIFQKIVRLSRVSPVDQDHAPVLRRDDEAVADRVLNGFDTILFLNS